MAATTAALATLPTTSDRAAWTPEEAALIEAAGLVHTDPRSRERLLAPRATVAAFLQHCARTGLDPIAKQIYCIARKSGGELKWSIQISIDGARLVAERSREYEGQTTPEFTADGVTWSTVWLGGPDDPPKAARVGVHRKGFREPMVAVALWDAYVQTRDEWVDNRKTGAVIVSEMWRKMGPLMLAKCAEMLALRKAFPQDLAGLYSAEEMSQDASDSTGAQPAPELAGGSGTIVLESGVMADAAEPAWSKDQIETFLRTVANETDMQQLRGLYNEAAAAGVLSVPVDRMGTTIDYILRERKVDLEHPDAGAPPADDEADREPEPESVPMVLDVEAAPPSAGAGVKAALRRGAPKAD